MEFTWVTVLTVGLAGFFGAGAVALWQQKHRLGAGIVAAIALACLAMAVVSVLPGGADQGL